MTTITLDVPDDLAVRLDPIREKLPDLLARAAESLFAGNGAADNNLRGIDPDIPVYAELLDFLASGPTPKQIADFKLSQPIQMRVEELLDLNRERGLTEEEAAEMDTYLKVNHIMMLLTARAHKALNLSLQ